MECLAVTGPTPSELDGGRTRRPFLLSSLLSSRTTTVMRPGTATTDGGAQTVSKPVRERYDTNA